MSTLTLAAAMGRPLNNAGYLVPVFKCGNGSFIQAGHRAGERIANSRLQELAKEKSAILMAPTVAKGLN